MKIGVFVKRVPSTDTKVRIAPDGKSLDPSGVEYVLNPYDEFAVEEALRTKDGRDDVEVVVVCLGPSQATKEIRTCLAMGADRAIHLEETAVYRDGSATASILTQVARAESFDLILLGRQAVDLDQSEVGAMLAEELGLPHVASVNKLEWDGDRARIFRSIEGDTEVIEASLPLVLTAQKGLNEPRYASLKGIMAAKKKKIDTRSYDEVASRTIVTSMELPAPRPPGKIVGEGADAVPELVRLLQEDARIL